VPIKYLRSTTIIFLSAKPWEFVHLKYSLGKVVCLEKNLASPNSFEFLKATNLAEQNQKHFFFLLALYGKF